MLRQNPLERLANIDQTTPKKYFTRRRVTYFFLTILGLLGKIAPPQYRSRLRLLIHKAGLTGKIRPEEFFGLKLIGLLTLPSLVFYFTSIFQLFSFQVPMVALSAIIGFTAPDFWLQRLATNRRRLIDRHFPDFVDLLATCVEAGLALEAAIDRISNRFPGPLGEEFQRYLWEVQIGRPRNLALMAVADRTRSEDIRIFAASLIQAELFGIPIANVLRAQAEALRTRRFQQARERARRAPLLMMPALAFCFCPVLFLILLVPLYLRARQGGLLQFLGF
ncbi:MAG: type II secretion system F family protein [Armatimonadetes bacterium]|nr:type II secretion system F family protein [Armatimonadota bacterium]